MIYRYYSKLRPVSYNTYPKNDNYIGFKNFDDRTFCDDVKDWAWGYVEYSKRLSDRDIFVYDLIDASKRWFYGVIAITNKETLKTIAKKYKNEFCSSMPEQLQSDSKHYERIVYWFETEEEANQMIAEYK
jgi:hypothetical protein